MEKGDLLKIGGVPVDIHRIKSSPVTSISYFKNTTSPLILTAA